MTQPDGRDTVVDVSNDPPPDSPDQSLLALAAAECGCFSVAQVAELGFSRNAVRHRVDSGRWKRHAYGVYGLSGWSDDDDENRRWQQKLWVASLHARGGGVAFRRTAGLWHQMDPIEGSPVELIVPLTAGRGLRGTVRYRSSSLAPEDVEVVRGMSVTTPARTVVDMAAVTMPMRLGRLINGSIGTGLLTRSELDDALLRGAISGRRGALRLARVLDQMSPGVVSSRSELERHLVHVVELSGLPEPVWEYPLPNAIGWTGFVDCCWPEVKFIVEADSRTWHDTILQAPRDQQRDAEANRVGYMTTRRRWKHLVHEAEATAALLRDTYMDRARLMLP